MDFSENYFTSRLKVFPDEVVELHTHEERRTDVFFFFWPFMLRSFSRQSDSGTAERKEFLLTGPLQLRSPVLTV